MKRAIAQIEAAALTKILAALDEGKPARSVDLSDEELEMVTPLYLLTMKPMIYAANVAEGDLADAVSFEVISFEMISFEVISREDRAKLHGRLGAVLAQTGGA
jgi:ribosome-binding ATPase YchF (GTP1/OBG family)